MTHIRQGSDYNTMQTHRIQPLKYAVIIKKDIYIEG